MSSPVASYRAFNESQRSQMPDKIQVGDKIPNRDLPFDKTNVKTSLEYLEGPSTLAVLVGAPHSEESKSAFLAWVGVADQIKNLGITKLACIVPGKFDIVKAWTAPLDPEKKIDVIIPDLHAELSRSMGLGGLPMSSSSWSNQRTAIVLNDNVVRRVIQPSLYDDESALPQYTLNAIQEIVEKDTASSQVSLREYTVQRIANSEPLKIGVKYSHHDITLDDGKVFSTKDLTGPFVIFSVPGARTPVCSNEHFPSFVRSASEYRNAGIPKILCLAPDEPRAMIAWGDDLDPTRQIGLIPSTEQVFEWGLAVEKSLPRGLGVAAKRTAMFGIADEDGYTIHLQEIDSDAAKCEASRADAFLTKIKAAFSL